MVLQYRLQVTKMVFTEEGYELIDDPHVLTRNPNLLTRREHLNDVATKEIIQDLEAACPMVQDPEVDASYRNIHSLRRKQRDALEKENEKNNGRASGDATLNVSYADLYEKCMSEVIAPSFTKDPIRVRISIPSVEEFHPLKIDVAVQKALKKHGALEHVADRLPCTLGDMTASEFIINVQRIGGIFDLDPVVADFFVGLSNVQVDMEITGDEQDNDTEKLSITKNCTAFGIRLLAELSNPKDAATAILSLLVDRDMQRDKHTSFSKTHASTYAAAREEVSRYLSIAVQDDRCLGSSPWFDQVHKERKERENAGICINMMVMDDQTLKVRMSVIGPNPKEIPCTKKRNGTRTESTDGDTELTQMEEMLYCMVRFLHTVRRQTELLKFLHFIPSDKYSLDQFAREHLFAPDALVDAMRCLSKDRMELLSSTYHQRWYNLQ